MTKRNFQLCSKKVSEDFLEVLKVITVAIVIMFIITRVTIITEISGSSMSPTLHNKERFVMNKLAYLNGLPKRGDIIVFKPFQDDEKHLVKRVIAIEGDTISIVNNEVYVNNKKIHESYIKEPMITSDIKIKLLKNEIFVMGDNRNDSLDSRIIGPINIRDVKGKILIY